MFEMFRQFVRQAAKTARLMVGQPDYEYYLAHMQSHHPDRLPMSREAFFRDRQDARYGGKGGRVGRCC